MRDDQQRGLHIVRGAPLRTGGEPELDAECRGKMWVGESMTDQRILGCLMDAVSVSNGIPKGPGATMLRVYGSLRAAGGSNRETTRAPPGPVTILSC